MINHSQLSSDKPDFQYDTAKIQSEGYRFKAAYDFDNPDLQEELEEIKKANIEYKIINGNGRQKDIWIKDRK